MRGTLMILSGPSGSGKGTVVSELLRRHPKTRLSISVTTRKPRPTETEGEHYFFVSPEQFEKMVRDGELLEHAVYCGECYGTPKGFVETCLAGGEDVLLEIEPQGARQVLGRMPDAAAVFVVAPSMKELERRLRNRMSETEEAIAERLAIAKEELAQVGYYRYVVINDEPSATADRLAAILTAERCKREHMKEWMNEVYLNA